MMRTLDGGRLAIFRRVELPGALPAIFSGARVAATYAAVGAVFGEWAGSSSGLGFVMLQAEPALDTARIFAAVLILSAIALGLYALVSLAERLLVPWNREVVHVLDQLPALAACGLVALVPAAAAGGTQVTLTLDWTPNPDHVGFYYARDTGLFRQSRPRRRDPRAVRSDRAAQARRARQERPRGLLRAGALLRRGEKLPVVAVAAVVPQPLNSIMAIEPEGEAGRRSPRQDDRDHRRPLRLRRPRHRARAPPASRATTSRSSPSATTCCRRCSRTGSTPCSASTATSKGSSSSARAEADDHPARPRRRPVLRRARPRRELVRLSSTRLTPTWCSDSCAPSARHRRRAQPPAALARDPAEGDRQRRGVPRSGDTGDARAARRDHGSRLHADGGVAAVRRVDAQTRIAEARGPHRIGDDDAVPAAQLLEGPQGEQHAAGERDAGLRHGEDVRQPARRAGLQRLAAERIRKPVGGDAVRRPVQGKE